MIKNLAIATLLTFSISSINPYNSYQFGTTFNRYLTEQYDNSPNNYAQYWSVGPNTISEIGGPKTRTRIIQRTQYGTYGNTKAIDLQLIRYTILYTEGNTYTGTQSWNSYLQLDPQMYDWIVFEHGDIYWDYGWNITDISNEVFNNFTSYEGITTQISNIRNEITTQNGTNITKYDYQRTTNPTEFNDTFNALNSWKDYTRNISETGTTDNSYSWYTYIRLRKYISDPTEQQIDIYNHALDNYMQLIIWNLDINGEAPEIPTGSYEVIDIPGLMFSILGMPFAWISTAFDLTIFPGTPYSINIAHLFMSVIGVLVFIFIIKKVIK